MLRLDLLSQPLCTPTRWHSSFSLTPSMKNTGEPLCPFSVSMSYLPPSSSKSRGFEWIICYPPPQPQTDTFLPFQLKFGISKGYFFLLMGSASWINAQSYLMLFKQISNAQLPFLVIIFSYIYSNSFGNLQSSISTFWHSPLSQLLCKLMQNSIGLK